MEPIGEQVEIVGLRIDASLIRCPGSVRRQELDPKRGGNLARDVILQDEDAADLAVERFRPDVLTIGDADHRSGDADLVSFPLDAAFEDVGNFELLADLAQIFYLAQAEGRDAPRHAQALDLHEGADDLRGDAVREVGLVAVRAEIGERHRQFKRNRQVVFFRARPAVDHDKPPGARADDVGDAPGVGAGDHGPE